MASSVGSVLGTGPGRGMGLMYEVIGILISLLALITTLSSNTRKLEQNMPDQPDSTEINMVR